MCSAPMNCRDCSSLGELPCPPSVALNDIYSHKEAQHTLYKKTGITIPTLLVKQAIICSPRFITRFHVGKVYIHI